MSCCDDKSREITAMRQSHARVLWIVLAINALMFLVEGWGGSARPFDLAPRGRARHAG